MARGRPALLPQAALGDCCSTAGCLPGGGAGETGALCIGRDRGQGHASRQIAMAYGRVRAAIARRSTSRVSPAVSADTPPAPLRALARSRDAPPKDFIVLPSLAIPLRDSLIGARYNCRRMMSRAILRTWCSTRPPRPARSSMAFWCVWIKKGGVDALAGNPCCCRILASS